MSRISSDPLPSSTGCVIAPDFDINSLREYQGDMLSSNSFYIAHPSNEHHNLATMDLQFNDLYAESLNPAIHESTTFTDTCSQGIPESNQIADDNDSDILHVSTDHYHRTLGGLIKEFKSKMTPISIDLIYVIMNQLTSNLSYLHGSYKVGIDEKSHQGAVYRNLRPNNILISEDGERLSLSNLEQCKNSLSNRSMWTGNTAYMAPETLIYGTTSPASDIWALGVVLYELLFFKPPNFLGNREPKNVFVEGWKFNLSAIKDNFIKGILMKIFVLDPRKRPTAKNLHELFRMSNTSTMKLKFQSPPSKSVLDNTDINLNYLVPDCKSRSRSTEIVSTQFNEPCSLKDTIASSTSLENNDYTNQSMDGIEPPKKQTVRLSSSYVASIINISWTPLMRAAVNGDIIMAMQHLSEKDKKTRNGETALILAARSGHEKIVELLDPTKNGVTALMRAIIRNDIRTTMELLSLQKGRRTSEGIMVSGCYISRGTALMIAAARGYTKMVKLLVEHEGGMQANDGKTALMFAAEKNRPECVKLLIEKEGGMKDNYGDTALITAIYSNCPECVKILLDKEGGMQEDSCGRTALMYAALFNRPECARLLVSKERNIKTTCTWDNRPPGTTALDIAKEKGYIEILKILLS